MIVKKGNLPLLKSMISRTMRFSNRGRIEHIILRPRPDETKIELTISLWVDNEDDIFKRMIADAKHLASVNEQSTIL